MSFRRWSLSRRKWASVLSSAPATLIDCTDPKVSPSMPVIRPVASRAATR